MIAYFIIIGLMFLCVSVGLVIGLLLVVKMIVEG